MAAKKSDTWMPLYVADYLRDTMHLTTEQHGAYMLLLMACWTRGGSLPSDPAQLAGIARMPLSAWRKAAPVLMAFFAADGDGLTHKRVTAEREKAQRLSDARRDSGSKGGRPRKQTESEEKPIGFAYANLSGSQTETPAQVALPSPSPTSDEVSEDAGASSVGSGKPMPTEAWAKDADFVAAWQACTAEGRARSSRKAAWPVWRKHGASPAAKLAALRAYLAADPDVKRTGGPGFHLWLRDKLDEWLDRPASLDGGAASAPAWNGPAAISAIMERAFGKPKAAAYLADYCTWQETPFETLIVSHEAIAKIIRREAGPTFEAHGVAVDVKGRAA